MTEGGIILTKLLAIETTETEGTVACAENGLLLNEKPLNPEQRSAQSLIPAIDAILKENRWEPHDLDEIAVAVGPGSFTGLRVGVTTAKILAWSCDAKIYGIDALSAMAYPLVADSPPLFAEIQEKNGAFSKKGAGQDDFIVSIGLDAQRGDVAVRDYLIAADSPRPIPLEDSFYLFSTKKWLDPTNFQPKFRSFTTENSSENGLLKQKDLLSKKGFIDENVPIFYCGPILRSWRTKIAESVLTRFIPERFWSPKASSVALAALDRGGKSDDVWNLLPVYSRESAAEEKRKKQQNK